jgi:hypothetical protein
VILALPKGPLTNIQFTNDDKDISDNLRSTILDSVVGFPLAKCFFVVKSPFWADNRPPNQYAYTVPTRELLYWKSRDRTVGLMMIYTDRPGTQFWSDYLVEHFKRLTPVGSPSDCFRRELPHAVIWKWEDKDISEFQNNRLLRTFLLFAREEGADSVTADRLVAAGMRDWGFKPYEGACHAWRAGSESLKVIKYLKGFSLHGLPDGKLHICGEAYSDYQGFIEGALRSAVETLKAINKSDGLGLTDLNFWDGTHPPRRSSYFGN